MLTTGCSKNNTPFILDTNATILQVKYACGPGCDAFSFIIKTSGNVLLTPNSLDQEFRINNLPVKIKYKNTGKFPPAFTGPDYELVEIIQINR